MKILFISMSPIHKGVSIGNTFLNVLEGMPDVTYFSVYTKGGAPDKSIQRAFQINEQMILKKLLRQTGSVGRVVDERYEKNESETSHLVTLVKKKRFTVFFWAQALVWQLPFWKSKALNQFLEEAKPDVLFTILSDSPVLNRLIQYIQAFTKKPLMVYAWDNNYTLKMGAVSPLRRLNRHINRIYMRKTVRHAAQMYVISDVQKRDYEKAFGRPCKVLTKSDDFSGEPPIKTQYNSPLQLVYTGNIGTNRWKSLAMIVAALRKLNQNHVRAQLRIYTATPLTKKMRVALDVPGTSFLMGSVSASEIPAIQSDADMLVHVEALDRKNRLAVRQSFSTKLVDYFKAARLIFAVGPRDVASIQHLIDNDAAVVASNQSEIYIKLKKIIETPQIIADYGKKAYECGRKHHNKEAMQSMLKEDLVRIARQ